MCNPATAMLAGSLVMAGSSIYGGIQSAKIGRENAAQFDQQARLREEKARFDADNAVNKFQRTQGAAIASIGTTGLDIRSFSDVLADSAIESALEVKAIKFQGAWEAANLRAQGRTQERQANAAMIGGIFGGVGQGLAGIGKYQAAQPGSGTGDVTFKPWSYTVNPNYNG